MTGIDDLPADQRAVLRLLLDQDRSYQEIAATLKMAPAAVRDRAHDALSSVGPADTPLGRERRAQVADWLLGQQTAAETETTEDLLRGSASARAWAREVSGQIEPLSGRPLPVLPDGEAGDPAAADAPRASSLLVDDEPVAGSSDRVDDATPSGEPRSRRKPSLRGMDRPSSRRGGAVLLAVLALLIAVGAGVLIGRATKDGGDDKASTSTSASASNITVLGQTNLRPPAGAPDKDAVGIAQFVERKADGKDDPEKLLNVIAQGLPKAPTGSGYGVWLTKPGVEPVWLGYFQAVTTTGEVGAQSALKVDPKGYERVILTRQRGQEPKTPGTIYLEGAVQINAASSG